MNYVPVSALTAAQEQAHREGREVTATELLLAASLHQMEPGAIAFEEWCRRMEPEPGYGVDAAGRFTGE